MCFGRQADRALEWQVVDYVEDALKSFADEIVRMTMMMMICGVEGGFMVHHHLPLTTPECRLLYFIVYQRLVADAGVRISVPRFMK